MKREDIIKSMYDRGLVKRGHFTLKSGAQSDIYLDMRALCSHPDLLWAVAGSMWSALTPEKKERIDCICGVPYGAVPLATAISLYSGKPQIVLRKEIKDYGMKKQVEGGVPKDSYCFLVEDVITTGTSMKEAAATLMIEGFHVAALGSVVLRDDFEVDMVEHMKWKFRSLLTLKDIRGE